MSDIFTGQMIKHNRFKIRGISNTVCLLNPLAMATMNQL